MQMGLAFNVQESFSKALPQIFKDSKVAQNWQCNRTKATVLVTNVLAPELHTRLLKLLHDNPFSIMVDETTCRSVKQHMGVVVKVFDPQEKKVGAGI